MKLYRYLTGPDDASFCRRVTEALQNGWELYGNPTLAGGTLYRQPPRRRRRF